MRAHTHFILGTTVYVVAAIMVATTGCGPGRRVDARRPGFDGGVVTLDSGPPPGFDSGPPPGFDSGPPPGFDSGPPPGFDSGPPPGRDGGPPPRDGGPPPGRDGGRPGCDVGGSCDPTRGCALSSQCIDEFMTEVGGTADPIVGLPGGATSIALTSWRGGYCTETGVVGSAAGCDPADDLSCGGLACAICINAGQDTLGRDVGLCASSCTPSLTTNPCRDTYECSRTNGACLPGCQSDNECRVQRPDTNGNGYIDPYTPTHTSGDRLTYDASTTARCNPITDRCEHNGRTGVHAGAVCDTDFDCERNGDCIADFGTAGGWPGGYCTKFGCDIAGNACAAGGKCQERGIGVSSCMQPCRVAQNVVTSDRFSAASGCRAGYACFWDGVGTATNNGGCIPGNYNAVRTANMGAACTVETSCYSPYGLGQCRDFGSGGQCTMFDCGAPGVPAGVCGAGALCAEVTGDDTTLCLETCTSASTCNAGAGCWDITVAGIDTGGARVCFPGCLLTSDCRTGQTCVGATGTTVGECI